MDRNATLKLTKKDKQAAKKATLGVSGMVQADGTG
jgi:hypothetical protein